MIYTKDFWKDTAERTIATMAETAAGFLGAAVMISDVNWQAMVSATAIAGAVTVLKCIVFATKKADNV